MASLSGQGNVAEYKHDLIHVNINLFSIFFLSLEDVSCLSCDSRQTATLDHCALLLLPLTVVLYTVGLRFA